MSPSVFELKTLLDELAKISNQKLSFEEIKEQIKNDIEAKKITTNEDIENYLNILGIVDKKEELLRYGRELLDKLDLNITPTEELCNEIIEEYKKCMSFEKQMLIEFKVNDASVENKYLEVSMATLKGDVRFDYPIKYVKFDDDTKKKLIEPIMKEVILGSKIEYSHFKNIDDLINDRVNYFLKTVKNCFINIKNIESYYAKEIQELIDELKIRYGENNPEERIDEINEELLAEEQLANELDGPKLVRKKDENKGFANSLIIFVVNEFFAGLFILLQFVLLK